MDNQETEKRWRRFETLRSRKHIHRRLKKMESTSLSHAHTFIVQRWANVRAVRRQALAWLLLVTVLIASVIVQLGLMRNAYQRSAAAEGGIYAEGVVGRLDSLNPIFVTTKAEKAASKLLYAGLLSHDTYGHLKPDLAESWNISEGGKRYTVVLRPDLKWQDNSPLDANDALFTFQAIKNPEVDSPLEKTWRNVTVTKVNNTTLQFDLPSSNGPFAQALTTGLISDEAYRDVQPSEYRSSVLDKQPITNGPFHFLNYQSINVDRGRLTVHGIANPNYHLGKVNLDRFQLHIYGERDQLKRAFLSGEINAASDLTASDVAELQNDKKRTVTDAPINSVAMAVFKTDVGILQDGNVRKALIQATDRDAIVKKSLHGHAKKLNQPLPSNMLSQQSTAAQAAFDAKLADELLTKQGWVRDSSGKRAKAGQPLTLTLATSKSGDYPKVVEQLKEQWSRVGVATEVILAEPEDVQQNIIAPRAYDVFIYELEVGADPDVYAYWHSSLAGSAQSLNLANLKSGKVDDALDTGRSRFEPDLRAAKYNTFVTEWLNEAPAVVLYQPTLHYVSNPQTSAMSRTTPLVDSVSRYNAIQYWSVASSTKNDTP